MGLRISFRRLKRQNRFFGDGESPRKVQPSPEPSRQSHRRDWALFIRSHFRRSKPRGNSRSVAYLLLAMRDETADAYARVHHRVDEILHYVWDPIGIAGTPAARDEYDGYVPTVVKLLFDAVAAERITQYLRGVEAESMGLSMVSSGEERRRRTAEMLIENYRWISQAR